MRSLFIAISAFALCLTAAAQNPFLPLWEHLADVEALLMEDPDSPGRNRIYLIGTHDVRVTEAGGPDIHEWSAPEDDLSEWKDEGPVCFLSVNGKWDMMRYPFLHEIRNSDGSRDFWLHPHSSGDGRADLICRGARPDGPFTAANLSPDKTHTIGDPANGAAPDRSQAPICKVGNKYVRVYTGTAGPEYGLEESDAVLLYDISDTAEGPWQTGGVLVDPRGPALSEDGQSIIPGYSAYDIRGNLLQAGGQWYVFYHRSPRGSGYARQAMVAPVTIEYDETAVAAGGYLRIYGFDPAAEGFRYTVKDGSGHEYTGAEVTSEGFSIRGLDPFRYYSAGYACFLSDRDSQQDSWDVWKNGMDITGVKSGDIIGYKYFDCSRTAGKNNLEFNLFLTPRTDREFTVAVWLDSPYANDTHTGTRIGEIKVPAGSPRKESGFTLQLGKLLSHTEGKHAIYLVAEGDGGGSLFDLQGLGFSRKNAPLAMPEYPEVTIKAGDMVLDLPASPTHATVDNGYMSGDTYDVPFTFPDNQGLLRIEATASMPEVKVELILSGLGANKAMVRCEWNGKTKTYMLLY